jgi:hypothetical protein
VVCPDFTCKRKENAFVGLCSYNPGYISFNFMGCSKCAIELAGRNTSGAPSMHINWKGLRYAVVIFHYIRKRVIKISV